MGKKKVAVLVGGGPAPGLNGVISSVTLESIQRGYEVVGIYNGFKWISSASFDPKVHTIALDRKVVDGIHFKGGSILGTARDSLIKNGKIDTEKVNNVKKAMEIMDIGYLVTTGGDDTAFSASIVSKEIKNFYVAHVPKTIDNDLPLPGEMPTFGFETARELGTDLLKNLLEDARTTGRWYFVVAMGRSAGHLALGMGIAAGATLTIIPEQFGDGKTTLKGVCDITEGSMLKRKLQGMDWGIGVIAEGVAYKFGDFEQLEKVLGRPIPKDPHGHPRLAEVPLGDLLKREIENRYAVRDQKITIVTKDIGYELRCADPIPFDIEYTRELGYGAMDFLLGDDYNADFKEAGAMISLVEGNLNPIPFHQIMDPDSGKKTIRLVNTYSYNYKVARAFMTLLQPSELNNPNQLSKFSSIAKMDVNTFKKHFATLPRI